jgi:hypothetical protein
LSTSSNKNSVIIVAETPIINPSEIIPYQNLSVKYSVFLNTLLFLNWIEILSEDKQHFNMIALLNEKDKEYLPKYFLPQEAATIFYQESHLSEISEYLFKQTADINSKTIILFYNSIGFKLNEISRALNLIQTEEPSIVIGKSVGEKIILVCSNGLDGELIIPILTSERKYDQYLSSLTSKDIFIHTLDGFLSIDNFEDIKKLYIELSKKESLSYCSQKMHENFNDLFIEYKELLNV